jgi:spore coat protein CotH
MPEGVERPQGGRGGFMSGHKLKERFLASAAWKDTYHRAYKELFNEIYGNAAALNKIKDITAVIGTVQGSDAAAVATEAENLSTLILQRTQFLATHEIVTG